MKFGQWGDSPAKEDGSFSFSPVNVVNSTAHTSAINPHQGRETQLPATEGAEFWGMGVLEMAIYVHVCKYISSKMNWGDGDEKGLIQIRHDDNGKQFMYREAILEEV